MLGGTLNREVFMEITLTIPDDVAVELQNGNGVLLSRRVLELAAIKAYEADIITGRQVQEMLGFADREELYAFFKANDVRHDYSIEDLERDSAALAELIRRHKR
jgi:molybdopterin-binding protein